MSGDSLPPQDGEGLNERQLRAVAHGDGPLLVIAGAGTGKTRTLAARVRALLARGVPEERVLLLTFTRQAAREMLSRVRSGTREPRVWGGTFHALANRLLRIYAEPLGLAPGFTVLDRSDAEDLLDLAREELGLRSDGAKRSARFPKKGTCLAVYSRCVNAEESVEGVLARRFPWVADHARELKELFRLYEERKIARSVLDLDDLLVWWRGLVEDERLGPEVAARFDHVLVDEYQDTNRIQRAILLALRETNRNITVVGDDCQAIYGFRAATVRNILDFERDFPGAEVVRLERNYRSTEPILAATNAVIALARERHAKTLTSGIAAARRPRLVRCRDEAAEVDFVIREALARLEEGIALRKQAVLFRAAHHSDLLEVELGRRRIPFKKFGGLRFLDAAHVKDLLAFLRIVENPKDEPAWFRLLKLLDGVGPRTAGRILERLAGERFSLAAVAGCEVPAPARAAWNGFLDLLRAIAPDRFEGGDATSLPVASAIERVRAFYEPLLAERYDHAASRVHDLDALARIAQSAASRREFLSDLALDPPSATGDLAGPPVLDEDWLVLSTIHSAKGLEWDAVTVIHAADGCIPSDLATGDAFEIEEERRLLYVALTRARRHLTVTAPLRFHVKDRGPTDRHVFAPLTRFIPEDVAKAWFELESDGPPEPRDATVSGRATAADEIRRKVLGRWA